MKTIKLLFAAAVAVMMTGSAFAEKTAKAVLENSGKTLRFVYDDTSYGTKDTAWFSVKEYEDNPHYRAGDPPWTIACKDTVVKVVFDSTFDEYKPKHCCKWFYKFSKLNEVANRQYFDTSEVTDMSYMFSECTSLRRLLLSSLDTGKLTDMSYMFDGCINLSTLVMHGWDTSNVYTMSSLFNGCESLTSLDVRGFDTSNVGVMSMMFCGCSSLTALDLTYFNTAAVHNMDAMFAECTSLTELDLSGFDTKNVTNFEEMFARCQSLKRIYASELFVVPSTASTEEMFKECFELKGSTTKFTSKYIDGYYARIDGNGGPGYFVRKYLCKAVLKDDGLTLTFIGDAVNYGLKGKDWFAVEEASESGDAAPWTSAAKEVTKVVFDKSFSSLSYTQSHFANWFRGMAKLEQINGLGSFTGWSACGSTAHMFHGCSSLKVIDLTGVDTSSVTNMSSMFQACYSLEELRLGNSKFSTANVTDMSSMFAGCGASELRLQRFDTAKVEKMSYMFSGCKNLKRIFVSDQFVTTKVSGSNGARMFASCASLVGGKGTVYSDDHIDQTYARMDGKGGAGYFMPEPQAVLENSGKTLRFVLDGEAHGVKGTDWFSVADAFDLRPDLDPPWKSACKDSVVKVVVDDDFSRIEPQHCGCWFANFKYLASVEGLKNLNTSCATNFYRMFGSCSSLETIDISGFDTGKVVIMDSMFDYCTSLKTIYASERFVTSQVGYSFNMFDECTALVGGKGTKYDSTKTDKTYARIDGGTAAPGYFTYKPNVPAGSFAIHFAADGGTGTMSDQTCARGKVWQLTKCAFTKSGKTFKGWTCSNGKRYDDGILVFDLADSGEWVEMTALWE